MLDVSRKDASGSLKPLLDLGSCISKRSISWTQRDFYGLTGISDMLSFESCLLMCFGYKVIRWRTKCCGID